MTGERLLLRQIHPSFVQDGRVTSQAFRPTSKDDGKLSTYDGKMISAEESWNHYTEEIGLDSAGVQGVSESECKDIGLSIEPDRETFDEHILIDFTELSNSQVRSKGKLLRNRASERGWLFQA